MSFQDDHPDLYVVPKEDMESKDVTRVRHEIPFDEIANMPAEATLSSEKLIEWGFDPKGDFYWYDNHIKHVRVLMQDREE